jgi:hypothetical protein
MTTGNHHITPAAALADAYETDCLAELAREQADALNGRERDLQTTVADGLRTITYALLALRGTSGPAHATVATAVSGLADGLEMVDDTLAAIANEIADAARPPWRRWRAAPPPIPPANTTHVLAWTPGGVFSRKRGYWSLRSAYSHWAGFQPTTGSDRIPGTIDAPYAHIAAAVESRLGRAVTLVVSPRDPGRPWASRIRQRPLCYVCPASTRPRCDNTTVAVILWTKDHHMLVLENSDPKPGIGLIASHTHGLGAWDEAARTLVRQYTGFDPTDLRWVDSAWCDDQCHYPSGPLGSGHTWMLYEATLPDVSDSPAVQVPDGRWITTAELRELAKHTVAYAMGEITSGQFGEQGGIQPRWIHWLHHLGWVAPHSEALAAVRDLAASRQ